MSLRDELVEAAKELSYQPETDAPVEVFTTRRKFETLEWDNLFRRLIKQDARWKAIREKMETELDDLRVVKTTLGAKVVFELSGADKDGLRTGVRLTGIET